MSESKHCLALHKKVYLKPLGHYPNHRLLVCKFYEEEALVDSLVYQKVLSMPHQIFQEFYSDSI